MTRKTGVWIVLAFAAAFAAIMYTSTRNLSAHRVEVCMQFNGREACRTASAATREQARRTATDNACAQIAAGMSDSIACTNSMPSKVTWLDAK